LHIFIKENTKSRRAATYIFIILDLELINTFPYGR